MSNKSGQMSDIKSGPVNILAILHCWHYTLITPKVQCSAYHEWTLVILYQGSTDTLLVA